MEKTKEEAIKYIENIINISKNNKWSELSDMMHEFSINYIK